MRNIPNEIFINIVSKKKSILNAKDYKFHDYRPEFISFMNPFLILLFSKLVNKGDSKIVITEMYPSLDELMKIRQKKYVSKYVCQWYSK